jgi:hypothetical protein
MGFVFRNEAVIVFEVQCQYELFHGCAILGAYRVLDGAGIAKV